MGLLLSRRSLHWLLLLALGGLWTCGGQAATPYPLTCHTAYRPNVSIPIQREDRIALSQFSMTPVTINYADLAFHAQYISEPGSSPSLNLFVTPPNRTDRLMSVLFQLPQAGAPANQFVGGHGFTGLHYVYHPSSGAELQFWCVAE
jgi:hypothetical protein